jgi:hypothetical protein
MMLSVLLSCHASHEGSAAVRGICSGGWGWGGGEPPLSSGLASAGICCWLCCCWLNQVCCIGAVAPLKHHTWAAAHSLDPSVPRTLPANL